MSSAKQGAPIQFRDAELEQQIAIRGINRNSIARRDLERYYDLLQREMEYSNLVEEEEYLIAEAANGMTFTEQTAPYIWAVVLDGFEKRGLGEKWRVRQEILIPKLRDLSPGQAMALADWIERWHRDPTLSQDVKDAIGGGEWVGVS